MRQVSVGLTVEPYETARLHKDGRSVPVLLIASPIYDAYGVFVGASKLAQDISARKDAERLQSVPVGELNHRVKNLFATVLAISRQTLGHGGVNAVDMRSFEARLSSMASAHGLRTHGTWQQAELRANSRLHPVRRTDVRSPALQSRSLQRSFRSAWRLMNSPRMQPSTAHLRYRAASRSLGQYKLGPGLPRMDHAMRGNRSPPVTPPTRRGFGSRLIESLLATEPNGSVKMTYDPKGVLCEVDANLLGEWDSSQNLIELEAWGAFLAVSVDWVRDHKNARADLRFPSPPVSSPRGK